MAYNLTVVLTGAVLGFVTSVFVWDKVFLMLTVSEDIIFIADKSVASLALVALCLFALITAICSVVSIIMSRNKRLLGRKV